MDALSVFLLLLFDPLFSKPNEKVLFFKKKSACPHEKDGCEVQMKATTHLHWLTPLQEEKTGRFGLGLSSTVKSLLPGCS